jgi:hypothetical protein
MQELLEAAHLDNQHHPGSAQLYVALSRQRIANEDNMPLPAATSLSSVNTEPSAFRSRRPNFHLPLDDTSTVVTRPRPRVDTTYRGLHTPELSALPADGPDLPTPVLSAALCASPLSTSSSGPITPSTGGLTGPLGKRFNRSPSLISMSPTSNPFQVLTSPPPVPALPASVVPGPAKLHKTPPMPIPLRTYGSVGSIERDPPVRPERSEDDTLRRSWSQQDVLAEGPDISRRAEAKSGSNPNNRAISRL